MCSTRNGVTQRLRLVRATAVDADSGKVLWKYDADTSMVASVTPTAGGLVLTGDTKGNFIALDARDGKVLLKKNLGDRSEAVSSRMISAACSISPSQVG